jgi:Carbohydrate binding domain
MTRWTRIVRLAFMAIFCLAFVAGYGYAADATANLLPNGGFDKTYNRKGKIWPGHWGVRLIPDAKGVSWRIDSENKKDGKNSLRVDTTAEKSLAIIVHSGVKVEAGESYKVSCWVRNTGSRFSVRQDLILPTGKHIRKRYKTIIKSATSHDWRRFEATVKAIEGEDKLGLTIFVGRKPGTVWLDDIRIEKNLVVDEDAVQFRMTPNYYLDANVYHLPEGAPMLIQLAVKNEGQHKPKSPRFILDLPEGIEMLGSDYDSLQAAAPVAIRRNGKPYVRYNYHMGLPRLVLRGLDFSHTAYNSTVILLRAKRDAGPDVFDAWCSFVDGPVACKPSLFKLKVVPALKPARAPKRFRIMADTSPSVEFTGDALSQWGDFYKACGFNEIYIPSSLRAYPERAPSRSPAFIMKAMKAKGLAVTTHEWALVNGYCLRNATANKAPDSARIKRADGSIAPGTFDPAYMYQGGEWFVRAMDDLLDNLLDSGSDNLWCNWEPYMYRMEKGSFTERSMRDFAKFTGRDYAAVRAMKPMDIVGNHREQLMKFQSWQFGKVMKAINDIVRAKSKQVGRRIDFIPCVGNALLSDIKKGMRYEEFARCFKGVEWVPNVDMVSSWEYVSADYNDFADPRIRKQWDLGARKSETTSGPMDHRVTHVETLRTVEKVTGFVARTMVKAGRKPIPYIHLTQNLQGSSMIVKPRAIGLQILAAFVGGAAGVDLYYFPLGYDGRYWRSAAEANDLIARYEDFVFDGKRVSGDFKITPMTALYRHEDFAKNLTLRAFQHKGRTLIALCNFDFLDDAVVKLRTPNLKPGSYALHMPHRKEAFTLNGSAALSQDALREVTLTVPPMSVEFIILEPHAAGREYGRGIDLAASAATALGRVPALDRAFQTRWKTLQEIMRSPTAAVEKFEKPNVVPIRKGKLIGEFVGVNDGVRYRVASGGNEILIDPTAGAIVASWKRGKAQLVQQGKGSAGIGRDRFYFPAKSMDLPELSGAYKFLAHRIIADGLEVAFERRLQRGSLAGIVINKTIAVGRGGDSIALRYRVTNTRSDRINAGFWVKNMLTALDYSVNAKPVLRFGAKEIKDFRGSPRIFKMNNADISSGYAAIFKRFLGRSGREAVVPTLGVDVKSASSTVRVSDDSNALYGYYVWGSPSSRIATLEAVFKPWRLEPGKAVDVSISFVAGK